jgi:mannitol-1-/sugar-/sorbitol-6-phosphatase
MQELITTRGLLFDMDGVLISSIGSVRRCWRKWCRHYGVPGADTFEIPHGTRAIEIIQQIKPDIDPQEGLRLIEDLEIEDTEDLRVLAGVPELLKSLPADRWTIVTSATRRLMLARLRIAGLPAPERLIAAEDVVNGKPDPEPYRRGAEILGLAPEDCIVVEDAPAGVSAGLAAGSRVLGVLGTHQAEELTHATWLVPSLRDVIATPGEDGALSLQVEAVG